MLNVASKTGIIEILSTLDDTAVSSLATTVTQGLLKNRLNSREDSINAILNYSSDALSFLRRKIITKEIILSYLLEKKVPVKLPATKSELIEKTASFWNIQYTEESVSEATPTSGTVQQLAETFADWFYGMLNKNECINPEHFYPDARLQINMTNNGTHTSQVFEGDRQQISQQLFTLRSTFQLLFNPNISPEGAQGRVDPHGLVLVLVCGTLHVHETCVGVFEQLFGLVRDPQVDNNWKIKTSELNLKSASDVIELPTLDNQQLLFLT